jgi:hypothetical protein
MARRSGWKRGDHLVMDEESGFTRYASEVGYDYYGVLKDKRQLDRANPQDFVRAKEDPYPVSPIHPPLRHYDLCATKAGLEVGTTGIRRPTGPASHLYEPGIGDAEIGCDFYVY